MSPKVWRLATVENIQKTICTNKFTVRLESPNSLDAQDSTHRWVTQTTAVISESSEGIGEVPVD